MIRFVRILRLLLSNRWAWRDVPEWTNEDVAALGKFLSTPTGAKLAQALRNSSIEANANAVANGSAHANGVAYGLIMAIRYIENFTRPVPPKEDESEALEQQGASILEHLNP